MVYIMNEQHIKDKNIIFNEWYDKNHKDIFEMQKILASGKFFLMQQAFWAGFEYKENND